MALPAKKRAELLIKEARVVDLYLQDMTFEEIAKEVGYSDKSAARKAFWRGVNRIPAEAVEELRAVENMKLDDIEERLEELKVGADTETELKVFDRQFKAMERRAKMNGTDMATKTEVDIKGGGFVPVAVPANRLPKKAIEQLNKEAQDAENDGEG